MIAKLNAHISMVVSSLQTALWFGTTCRGHRRAKCKVLPFLLALAFMSAQPLAAQEQITVSPSGVVSWEELLLFQQLAPTYRKQLRVVPFMPAPEPRALGEPVETMPPAAPPTLDSYDEGGAALIPVIDDFPALGDNNTSIPPDTMGAAGPNHLMTMLNTEVRIQVKQGNNLSTVTLDTFWTGPGTGLAGDPYDPRLIYDSLSDRWMATVEANPDSAASAVWFAVSDNSDPTGNWIFYAIDADPANIDWADFPDIGVNSTWVAITNNMFPIGPGGFSGAKMWVIDKSTLGGALTVTVFPTRFDLAGGFFGFTLRPAVTFDAAESSLYIVDGGLV